MLQLQLLDYYLKSFFIFFVLIFKSSIHGIETKLDWMPFSFKNLNTSFPIDTSEPLVINVIFEFFDSLIK